MDFVAEVKVSLKPGVVDAEGETVGKNLRLLGYEKVEEVKTSKVYRIVMEEESEKRMKTKMKEACEKLLANPVIQEYEINIKEAQ